MDFGFYSGNVVGLHYNNKPYYFQKNLQGDVIRILDYSGNVVVEYTYDAWGKVLSVTGSLANTLGQRNPFRYRSYYYDSETGFYYLQSRYYDPTVGRFLNADGIIGANGGILGYNMFAYCSNNPIIYSDPSGKCYMGDPFFTLPTSKMYYKIGDTCSTCGKVLDDIYFDNPYLWTDVYLKYPELSGEQISVIVDNGCTNFDSVGVVSLSLTVQVGNLTYQTALVIDKNECEIQSSIGISSVCSFGISLDVTTSTAKDVSDMKGATVYYGKSVNFNRGDVHWSLGIMPSGYTTYSVGLSVGKSYNPDVDAYSTITWTW